MKRKVCSVVLAALLTAGCTGSGASGWSDAPVLFRTVRPPEASLLPPELGGGLVGFHAVPEGSTGGLRVYPAPSNMLVEVLRQAGLPVPDDKGVFPAEMVRNVGSLAELAAETAARVQFNIEGSRRYGFRRLMPGGGFDFSPGRVYETGRALDFAVDDFSGREFLVLVPRGKGPRAVQLEASRAVLARTARMYRQDSGYPLTREGYAFWYLAPSGSEKDFGPASVSLPEDVMPASEDGVHFALPAEFDWKKALRPAALVSGSLEGPNIVVEDLATEVKLAGELQALLRAMAGPASRSVVEKEFILGCRLSVSGEFLENAGLTWQQEQGVVNLRVEHIAGHRKALVTALEALLSRMEVIRENYRHAGDTASNPDELYRPRTVVIEPDGQYEAREIHTAAQRTYAPKDPKADEEGYVYSLKTMPELEAAAFRATMREYEILRRAAERAFPEVVFPEVRLNDFPERNTK